MDELEILKQYWASRERARVLEITVEMETLPERKEEVEAEQRNAHERTEELKKQLIELPDKNSSEASKGLLISQLKEWKRVLKETTEGTDLRICRVQGFGADSLFVKIKDTLWPLVQNGPNGFQTPHGLKFTLSNENSVRTSDLIEFLDDELGRLADLEPIHYPALINFVEDFVNRMHGRFIT